MPESTERAYLRTIRKAVQRHLKAGHHDPVSAGIADTYPVTGERIARENLAYLMSETEVIHDVETEAAREE